MLTCIGQFINYNTLFCVGLVVINDTKENLIINYDNIINHPFILGLDILGDETDMFGYKKNIIKSEKINFTKFYFEIITNRNDIAPEPFTFINFININQELFIQEKLIDQLSHNIIEFINTYYNDLLILLEKDLSVFKQINLSLLKKYEPYTNTNTLETSTYKMIETQSGGGHFLDITDMKKNDLINVITFNCHGRARTYLTTDTCNVALNFDDMQEIRGIHIANFLNNVNIDVVCLQEVSDDLMFNIINDDLHNSYGFRNHNEPFLLSSDKKLSNKEKEIAKDLIITIRIEKNSIKSNYVIYLKYDILNNSYWFDKSIFKFYNEEKKLFYFNNFTGIQFKLMNHDNFKEYIIKEFEKNLIIVLNISIFEGLWLKHIGNLSNDAFFIEKKVNNTEQKSELSSITINPGLYIYSKFPILEQDARPFSNIISSDVYTYKGIIYAKIDLRNTGKNIKFLHVFNTHPAPYIKMPDSIITKLYKYTNLSLFKRLSYAVAKTYNDIEETHKKQLEEIKSFINDKLSKELPDDVMDSGILLMGDMNINKYNAYDKNNICIIEYNDKYPLYFVSLIKNDEYNLEYNCMFKDMKLIVYNNNKEVIGILDNDNCLIIQNKKIKFKLFIKLTELCRDGNDSYTDNISLHIINDIYNSINDINFIQDLKKIILNIIEKHKRDTNNNITKLTNIKIDIEKILYKLITPNDSNNIKGLRNIIRNIIDSKRNNLEDIRYKCSKLKNSDEYNNLLDIVKVNETKLILDPLYWSNNPKFIDIENKYSFNNLHKTTQKYTKINYNIALKPDDTEITTLESISINDKNFGSVDLLYQGNNFGYFSWDGTKSISLLNGITGNTMTFGPYWSVYLYELIDHIFQASHTNSKITKYAYMSVLRPTIKYPIKQISPIYYNHSWFSGCKYDNFQAPVWKDLSDHYPVLGRFYYGNNKDIISSLDSLITKDKIYL